MGGALSWAGLRGDGAGPEEGRGTVGVIPKEERVLWAGPRKGVGGAQREKWGAVGGVPEEGQNVVGVARGAPWVWLWKGRDCCGRGSGERGGALWAGLKRWFRVGPSLRRFSGLKDGAAVPGTCEPWNAVQSGRCALRAPSEMKG